jgi:hypothetical protein
MKEWIETKSGGYWSVTKKYTKHHLHKLPLFCPYEKCRKPTGTVDDKYLLKYGVCYECYTMYIDARNTPAIDIEFYKDRLKERGY